MPRGELQAQGTTARATRRKNERARRAGRVLAKAGWLLDTPVFWTGRREGAPRLDGAPVPVRVALEDRLARLPAGLYAVRLALPSMPPGRRPARERPGNGGTASALSVEVLAIESVTSAKVAETARAIEATAKYPTAAARFIGSGPSWREEAKRSLDAWRRAAVDAGERRNGRPGALALEALAVWVGSGERPSATLTDAQLSAWSADTDDANALAARLAAVALGQRRRLRICHARLERWAAAGRALRHWHPAAVARAAADIGQDCLAALTVATPALHDVFAAAWADERTVSPHPVTAQEINGLAQLLAAIAAVRREPARRHEIMCRLARQYLQLVWARRPDGTPVAQTEVEGSFRNLVLDEVYGAPHDSMLVRAVPVPESPGSLMGSWIGDGVVGGRAPAYVDRITVDAARALGSETYWPAPDDAPRDLSGSVPPGSAPDPAGPVAAVVAAARLHRHGAAQAYEAMAEWIEACRPLLQLSSFWESVFAIVPSMPSALDATRAQLFVDSLRTHGPRVAAELALRSGDEGVAARAMLPAVLVRGPGATDRTLCRELWMADEDALDAALRFVEAAERLADSSGHGGEIPMPRRVFSCEDPILRAALLEFGLAIWAERAAEAKTVAFLLNMILNAATRTGAAPWASALPRLRDAGLLSVRRKPGQSGASTSCPVGDSPVLAFFVLDICARWVGAGFTDTRRLARILSDRWASSEEASVEWDPDHDDHNRLVVQLSEGRIARFLALLRLPRASRRHAWRGIDGFRVIEKHPTALAWVSACLDRTELASRVVHLLERIGLMTRLSPGLRPGRMFARLDRAVVPQSRWPPWIQPEDRALLAEICQAGAIAGVPGGVPRAVQRVLDRKATMARERTALRARAGRRRLSPAEAARAGRVEELLTNPDALDADLRRALGKLLPKSRAQAGLMALEAIVGQDLDRRWRQVLGGDGVMPESPAWDNALLMLETVTHNRRLLRRLLRHAAQGDRAWVSGLDPNRAFLDRLSTAAIRTDAWLAERSRAIDVPGDVFTAYATTDPLEVLQMGSLFGTCLSADRFNAHAAVAAAVEVNKRVLFVKDRHGRVLGRQLLAITGSGDIIGFTCYGAGLEDRRKSGLWVRLALALLTLEIVRASGARLMPGARLAEGLTAAEERSLSLFCTGYVDTPEPFDWWIEELAAIDQPSALRDREWLRTALAEPVPAHRDARAAPGWRRDELGWAACRALLWLGPDAPSLSAEQERALGLDTRQGWNAS